MSGAPLELCVHSTAAQYGVRALTHTHAYVCAHIVWYFMLAQRRRSLLTCDAVRRMNEGHPAGAVPLPVAVPHGHHVVVAVAVLPVDGLAAALGALDLGRVWGCRV